MVDKSQIRAIIRAAVAKYPDAHHAASAVVQQVETLPGVYEFKIKFLDQDAAIRGLVREVIAEMQGEKPAEASSV